MSLSVPKVALAVLYRLHEHAESNGEELLPEDISRLLSGVISTRRIQLGLEELESRQEVENVYHPHYAEEGLWQITRKGMDRVDRALRVPHSFVSRFRASGNAWLLSEEAKTAVLSKVGSADSAEPASKPAPVDPPGTSIRSPVSSATAASSGKLDWSKIGAIGTWIGVPIAAIAILVSLWIAGKI